MRIGMRKIKTTVTSESCKVRTEYKNKDLKVVSERECSLKDHTDTLRATIIRMIPDIEDLSYRATDGKSKEEWPRDVMDAFQRIRHKLLDVAGEIERLPENMFFEVFENERMEEPELFQSSPRVSPMSFSSFQQEDDSGCPKKTRPLTGFSGQGIFDKNKKD